MKFFNFTKQVPLSGIFEGFTDWHCHILPGVDDGFRTLEDSLDILSLYEESGVSQVWLTPHIMEDIPNTPEFLRERFAELKNAYNGQVELHLASENMLDSLFQERLESGDLLPLGSGQLLVETSYYNPPLGFRDMLRSVRKAGFEPVLAHPERYRYMVESDYESLHSEGITFQLNVPSLLGLYGNTACAKAQWMLERSMYSLCATDLHQRSIFEKMLEGRLGEKLMERLELLL